MKQQEPAAAVRLQVLPSHVSEGVSRKVRPSHVEVLSSHVTEGVSSEVPSSPFYEGVSLMARLREYDDEAAAAVLPSTPVPEAQVDAASEGPLADSSSSQIFLDKASSEDPSAGKDSSNVEDELFQEGLHQGVASSNRRQLHRSWLHKLATASIAQAAVLAASDAAANRHRGGSLGFHASHRCSAVLLYCCVSHQLTVLFPAAQSEMLTKHIPSLRCCADPPGLFFMSTTGWLKTMRVRPWHPRRQRCSGCSQKQSYRRWKQHLT